MLSTVEIIVIVLVAVIVAFGVQAGLEVSALPSFPPSASMLSSQVLTVRTLLSRATDPSSLFRLVLDFPHLARFDQTPPPFCAYRHPNCPSFFLASTKLLRLC
jgi:hypothetical protein